jgi:hypothetical protein
MSFAVSLLVASLAAPALHAHDAKPFTLQQVLSAPYSTSLTAAPVGNLFAWVEDAEGRHNLWVGGPGTPARELTHNLADDAQDITQLTWSPDATAIAYTYGAESGADGKPANPAHLQRPTPLEILIQPVALGAPPIDVGEGHGPLFNSFSTAALPRNSPSHPTAGNSPSSAIAAKKMSPRTASSRSTTSTPTPCAFSTPPPATTPPPPSLPTAPS